MYRTVLSHQSLITGNQDVFAVDNQVMQKLAYNTKEQLFRILDTSCYNEMKFCGCIKMFKGENSSLRIYTNKNNEILIRSNFENKDEKGRRVTYSFYHNSANNPEEICELLKEHAKLLGMLVNEDDLSVIKQTLIIHLHCKPKYAIVICLLIISMILAFGKCGHAEGCNDKASQQLSMFFNQ